MANQRQQPLNAVWNGLAAEVDSMLQLPTSPSHTLPFSGEDMSNSESTPSPRTGKLTPRPPRKSKDNPAKHLVSLRRDLMGELWLRSTLADGAQAKELLRGLRSRVDHQTYALRPILLSQEDAKIKLTRARFGRPVSSTIPLTGETTPKRGLPEGSKNLDREQPKYRLLKKINRTLRPGLEEEQRKEHEIKFAAGVKSERDGLQQTLRDLQTNPWVESLVVNNGDRSANFVCDEVEVKRQSDARAESVLARVRQRRVARADKLANVLRRRVS